MLKLQEVQAEAEQQKAIAEDEHFGRAYYGLAISLGSLGRDDEADATWKLALQNLGSMTERERLRTLGLYYSRVTRNREKAIESYTALVGQAGERVSGIYEAAPGDFNPQTYRRGRETFDAGWAALKTLLEASRAGDGEQERAV